MVADLPVTPGGCQRRRVCSRLIRRVISPPGQHKMFQPRHLKVPHLGRVVSQGLCPMILHNWPPNSIARGGRRTLSMCSGSTISITPPPLGRQNGYGSGISSSHTSFCTWRRHWVSRKGAQWITCHTSRNISGGPRASASMGSEILWLG